MSMTETKGPRPYHFGRKSPLRMTGYGAGTHVFAERAKVARPADWTVPQYPGDSIMLVLLVKGDEMGDVRVQWYGQGMTPKDDDKLKVGAFLPGVVECSPGDTPKVWPDKSEMVTDRAAASKLLVQYLIAAFRDGWSIYDRNAN